MALDEVGQFTAELGRFHDVGLGELGRANGQMCKCACLDHGLGKCPRHINQNEPAMVGIDAANVAHEVGFIDGFDVEVRHVRFEAAVPAMQRARLVEIDDVHGSAAFAECSGKRRATCGFADAALG